MVEDNAQFTEALLSFVESSDHVEIIAGMEFLAFVVFASQEASSWYGLLVFYVTDNQNMEAWIASAAPGVESPAGSHCSFSGSRSSVVSRFSLYSYLP